MLDGMPRGSRAMTTKEVALLLRKSGRRVEPLPTIEKSLMKGVQTLPPGYATHDGEVFKLYGREYTRWRWWGQMEFKVLDGPERIIHASGGSVGKSFA